MAAIKNVEGLTVQQVNDEIQRGGKFVIYYYAFSIVVMTFRRSSDIYFVRYGESQFKNHIWLSVATLLFGWWGFPWGPIRTVESLIVNLGGGKNVTNEVVASFNRKE